ncbi:MAG: hypothetical protein FWG80_04830 [Alphaproteobacteria bacterium]|nr:hypothetical protein [Alphaproteobacteria bacterium]
MFDASLVVQSAISTFNNAALRAPDFFWVALLCLPLFVVAWVMAPQISDLFLQDKKTRNYKVSILAIILIFGWVLTHENFNVLRDGASYVNVLAAFVLYFCTVFLSREYYEQKIRLSQLVSVGEKWKSRIDLAVPLVVIIIAGLRAIDAGWEGIALQSGAVAIGWGAGFLLNLKNAQNDDPKLLVGGIIFACTLGLIMQPEFFRFGQLAHLTSVHLLFLAAMAIAVSSYAVLHFVRPRGLLIPIIYNRIKLLLRMMMGLVLVLFFITESAPVFFMFALAGMISSVIYVLHQPVKSADSLKLLKHGFWFLSLGLFGILTVMPVLTAVAIILWRVGDRAINIKKIRDML